MESTAKKVRKSLTLQMKIQILDCLAAGEKISQVGRKFGISHTTIITIRKKEASIRQAVMRGMGGYRTSYVRDPLIEGMEKTLLIWIEDNQQRGIQVNGEMIRQRALQIHNLLQADEDVNTQPKRKFHASSGWLVKFVQRYSLRNVGVVEVSPSVDTSDSSVSQPQQPLEHVEFMELIVDPVAASNGIEIKKEHPIEFNQDKLDELLKMSGRMIDVALDGDLKTERAMQFRRDMKRAMASYTDLHEKQSNMLFNDYNSVHDQDVLSS